MDTYQTIEMPSEGEYKEKGSKFIAFAYEVESEAQIKSHLEYLKKEHFKSRHHCYAYRLGLDGKKFRANDDGEPSGTAGLPILGQIDSFGLTNILIVVVRYFGGTKLGKSGLKNAYKISSKEALENATIIERIIKDQWTLSFAYTQTSAIMNYIKSGDFEILEEIYEGHQMQLHVQVRQNESPLFKEKTIELGAKCERLETKKNNS